MLMLLPLFVIICEGKKAAGSGEKDRENSGCCRLRSGGERKRKRE